MSGDAERYLPVRIRVARDRLRTPIQRHAPVVGREHRSKPLVACRGEIVAATRCHPVLLRRGCRIAADYHFRRSKPVEIVETGKIVWGLFDAAIDHLPTARKRRPDAKPLAFQIAIRLRVRDGKILEHQTFFDTAAVQRAATEVSAPETPWQTVPLPYCPASATRPRADNLHLL